MILAFRDLKFSRAQHLYFKIYIHQIYLAPRYKVNKMNLSIRRKRYFNIELILKYYFVPEKNFLSSLNL